MLVSTANAPYIFNVSNADITFRSDAPLELIKASSNQVKGRFDAVKKQFSFSVNIKSFTGFNSLMQQEHFNEHYMESDKYPQALFEGRIIEDFNFLRDGLFNIRAKGNLSIHGVTQERIIKCELVVKNNIATVKANFTVLLSEHNIQIPKVLHEKLANEIKVEVRAELIEK